jgi:DNA mismatch repair protein MutS2
VSQGPDLGDIRSTMDLDARTLDALDWSAVLDALAEQAATAMGAAACRALAPLRTPAGVRTAHDGVAEVLAVRESAREVPVGDVGDIGDAASRAAKGEVLDLHDLQAVGHTLSALRHLERSVSGWDEDLPVLQGLAASIVLEPRTVALLEDTFDETGALSAITWPVLGELRKRITDLHASIRHTLDELLRSDDLQDLLQDHFVTLRRERYVLPIKSRAKRWDLGIVHGTSGSGATVFIEPNQVVQLNNRLRVAEGELAAEEARIRAMLSRKVGEEADAIHAALEAATEMDVLGARAGLAVRLAATRPKVGQEGVIRLRAARHPVLALRGVVVVPNDLGLDDRRPALVLSGPNAGGKTVALKTLGLCAMLTRYGCFVPAEEGSRVDLFGAIYADVGDPQSIEGDLSSFSGHLLGLREMLDRATPGVLLLLDEIATGTDPGQGAALARALLEATLDRGARVVVTTHYAQLKGLAAADPRFAIAAVEYAEGRPTYRVVPDVTGESHALEIAARLGLDPTVVSRARALMSTPERAFADALRVLEQQREEAAAAARAAQETTSALESQRATLAEREALIRERARELERREAAEFLARLRGAEKAIGQVVAELQRNPTHEGARQARTAVRALRDLVPSRAGDETGPPATGLTVGDRVRLRKLDQEGEVVGVGEGGVQVRAGGLTVRASPAELEPLGRKRKPTPSPPPAKVTRAPAPPELEEANRIPGNTLDLRGMRVDEALAATEQYLDEASRERLGVVFLLHGHGTGALKQALRVWLRTSRYVASSRPASLDQGGDAFTAVALR